MLARRERRRIADLPTKVGKLLSIAGYIAGEFHAASSDTSDGEQDRSEVALSRSAAIRCSWGKRGMSGWVQSCV